VPFARISKWGERGLEIQDDFVTMSTRTLQLDDYHPAEMFADAFFSPNDGWLAAVDTTNKALKIWNTKTLLCDSTCFMPWVDLAMVRDVAFDNQGKFVAVGIDDVRRGANGIVLVYEARTGNQVLRADTKYRVFDVVFGDSGELLVAGGFDMLEKGCVVVRTGGRFENERVVPSSSAPVSMSVISPTILATGGWDGEIVLWDLGVGKRIATVNKPSGKVMSLAVLLHSRLLASGNWSGSADIWRIPEEFVRVGGE
jgi:WD40 repeat protein